MEPPDDDDDFPPSMMEYLGSISGDLSLLAASVDEFVFEAEVRFARIEQEIHLIHKKLDELLSRG